MAFQPDQVSVGGIKVMAFASMAQLVNFIIRDDGSVFAGAAIAINPEKVMKAQQDPALMQILNNAELRYADGMGVVKVMQKKLQKPVERVPGCETWEALMHRAAEKKVPVFLIGAKPEVLQSTKSKLEALGVPVVGAQDGYFKDEDALISQLVQSGAKVITVAMGSPKQELFIEKAKKQLPDAYFMGVGGTYDVFTGNVKRAPALWCKLNLEWAYRLLSQPSRIKRQWNLVEYLWLYLRGKL
ncbi:MAG TPA: lipopolysaccharide N-acetylmannosaminouronosyltransferase [Rheinheimera sp.]|uniref:WecB/TagA/CpsF family glycosyltransferase n=1 Tax=Rheinheimera sp. TaxID=1869214 RepID=UPI000EDCE88F|nr:WecB/TagA/CpsF family glycosyltransferase [Rheinheimera sp.]HCU66826.1 lipopolysaccharide N-acetylmannosaminouronosyltransferase [Rheinheimera sp.]